MLLLFRLVSKGVHDFWNFVKKIAESSMSHLYLTTLFLFVKITCNTLLKKWCFNVFSPIVNCSKLFQWFLGYLFWLLRSLPCFENRMIVCFHHQWPDKVFHQWDFTWGLVSFSKITVFWFRFPCDTMLSGPTKHRVSEIFQLFYHARVEMKLLHSSRNSTEEETWKTSCSNEMEMTRICCPFVVRLFWSRQWT